MADSKAIALWAAGIIAVVLLATTALGTLFWARLYRPFKAYSGDQIEVEVPRRMAARDILAKLESEGIIPDARLARLYLKFQRDGSSLKAGEYRFEEPLSTPQVLDILIRGQVVTHPVTIIEGLTLEETAFHLAAEQLGDHERFLALMQDPAPLATLDPAAASLEGYLFPNTYHFARGTREEEIVTTLWKTFMQQFDLHVAPLLPEDHSISVRELVTLASIVEKEAMLDAERPVVAGVYWNRLQRNIALHADPTVIYALKLENRWTGNLRRDDLKLDSPYNTYVYPGLPPGPIASPGLASLQAAARPAEVPYLYFVSRNDGTHVFARTLAEHNRNVYRWQKLYWQRRWAEERRRGESATNSQPPADEDSPADDGR